VSLWMILPVLTSLLLAGSILLTLLSWPSVWDAVTARYIADISPSLNALNLDQTRIPFLLRIWGFLLVTTFLVLLIPLQQIPMSFMAAYLIYMAPRWYLSGLIRKRQIQLRDQLVSAVQMLANASRAGLSLAQGLEAVSTQTPAPLSEEISRIVGEFHRGLPLSDSIEQTKRRLNLESFTTFSAVIQTSLERGGKTTVALEKIANSLEEQQRLERRIESETASGRKVLTILAVFPAIFVLVFLFLFPDGTMRLFTTIVGQILLVVVVVLIFICVVWGQRIMSIE
jgi:tight adherence protein B